MLKHNSCRFCDGSLHDDDLLYLHLKRVFPNKSECLCMVLYFETNKVMVLSNLSSLFLDFFFSQIQMLFIVKDKIALD